MNGEQIVVSNTLKRIFQTTERTKKYDKLLENLNGFYFLDWERTMSVINDVDPTNKEKQKLSIAIKGYIRRTLDLGQFTNLRNIEHVSEFLGINIVEITNKWLRETRSLCESFSLRFLNSMSPTTWDNKIKEGQDFESAKYQYTIELLKKEGVTKKELNVDFAKKLWEVRGVLIKLHGKRPKEILKLSSKISITKLIYFFY